MHAVQLQLDELLLEQHPPALDASARVRECLLARVLAHAERIGGKLEIAEDISSGTIAAAALHVRGVGLPDDVGVWHTGVLENHLAVLIEPPAALVEHLADAESGRIARHHEHGGAFAQGDVGVGARVDEKELPDGRVGDEAFLAVQDPLVAFAFRPELQAGFRIVRGRQAVVGAGVRLADALAEEKSVVGEKRFEKPLLLLIGANRRDQVAPLPALAEGLRDGAVGLGELHHHQRLRHEVGSLPAPLLGNRHRAKAEPGSLLDDLPVESLARMADRVARERYRTDLLQRELARLHLPGALLFVQGKVHVESLR